jgi:hypothetical protein
MSGREKLIILTITSMVHRKKMPRPKPPTYWERIEGAGRGTGKTGPRFLALLTVMLHGD